MGSQLQTIQQEILRRFQRPRTVTPSPQSDQQDVVNQDGSWQGVQAERPRSVFAPQPQPSVVVPQVEPQVTTSTNQANITRPRSVFAPPQSVPQPSWMGDAPSPETSQAVSSATPPPVPQTNQTNNVRQRSVFAPPQQTEDPSAPFGSSGQPFGASRDRRTQPRDYVADDSQYLNNLQSKPPKWTDKAVGVLRGVNQAFGSNPNIFTPTKGEREELKARGMLGQDIAIQKEKTAQEMAQMVPIHDAGGNVIGMAPRRTAAGTQIRATDTGTRAAETKRRNDAYVEHLGSLPKEKQAEAARKMWLSGVADGNDDLKAELAKRMGISEELPDTDKGTIQTDASGNIRVVHGRTGISNTVTDETTGNPVGSWTAAQFKAAETGRDKRAQARNAQSERNATIMAGGVVSRMGDPAVHQKNMAEIDQDMESVDTEMNGILARQQKEGFLPTDPTSLNQLRQRKNALERERRGEREKLGKIESAQGNLQTRGGNSPKKYSSLDDVIRDFKNSPKNTTHRDPTPDEVNKLKAKYGVQ